MATVAKFSSVIDVETTADDELHRILNNQREAFRRHGAPGYEQRIAAIEKVRSQILKYKDEIAEAVSADFGHRSTHETMLAEVFGSLNPIKHVKKNLKKWMKPERRPISINFKPASGRIIYQPLGVIGIMAPWNYPVYLALVPLVEALGAGNRVMIKPSELTPRTSELLKKMLGEVFDEAEVAVVTGGPEVGAAFSGLAFDHLLYTGSTRVGRLVMKAAADKMVPVTLELGGKSPTIIAEDYPLDKAAGSIASGKLLNAGQTCIAPDYVMVPEGKQDAFVEEFRKIATQMYPSLVGNPDFTSIVSDSHYERITRLIRDAQEKGAKIVQINPKGEEFSGTRKIAPTIVLGVTEDMEIMQEEIFGPVLPVKTVKSLDEAIDYVNDHPRPLALYVFTHDKAQRDKVLNSTTSGGACANEVVFHVAQEELPFGGVGPSGTGAYHGEHGFRTFSHAKSVFYQSRFNLAGMVRPPYGTRVEKMLKMLMK
jgi:coniferyl-aldehyde dehydrogenase